MPIVYLSVYLNEKIGRTSTRPRLGRWTENCILEISYGEGRKRKGTCLSVAKEEKEEKEEEEEGRSSRREQELLVTVRLKVRSFTHPIIRFSRRVPPFLDYHDHYQDHYHHYHHTPSHLPNPFTPGVGWVEAGGRWEVVLVVVRVGNAVCGSPVALRVTLLFHNVGKTDVLLSFSSSPPPPPFLLLLLLSSSSFPPPPPPLHSLIPSSFFPSLSLPFLLIVPHLGPSFFHSNLLHFILVRI